MSSFSGSVMRYIMISHHCNPTRNENGHAGLTLSLVFIVASRDRALEASLVRFHMITDRL